MTPEAKEWLKQAKENLKDARAMLRAPCQEVRIRRIRLRLGR
ncbi:MAG: hypothetical protein M0Z41_19965 [Peptococcaceae bacterium]|jgi:hypothetical protein|nr:hypothetical protein [Peptococcaceae bacterium]